MRLEIRSARTTLNPTRQEVMPRRAARFFRFSLSLSPSFSFLSPSSCLTFLPSYLPSTYLPLTPYSSRLCLQPCSPWGQRSLCRYGWLSFLLLLPFSILNQRHPPLPMDISCIIFSSSSPNSSLMLPPQFPHTFFRNNCFFAFFYFYYILFILLKIHDAYLIMRFTSLCSVALRPLLSRAPPSQQDVCTELRIAFTTHRLSG